MQKCGRAQNVHYNIILNRGSGSQDNYDIRTFVIIEPRVGSAFYRKLYGRVDGT